MHTQAVKMRYSQKTEYCIQRYYNCTHSYVSVYLIVLFQYPLVITVPVLYSSSSGTITRNYNSSYSSRTIVSRITVPVLVLVPYSLQNCCSISRIILAQVLYCEPNCGSSFYFSMYPQLYQAQNYVMKTVSITFIYFSCQHFSS